MHSISVEFNTACLRVAVRSIPDLESNVPRVAAPHSASSRPRLLRGLGRLPAESVGAAASATIPDSLTDREFWSLFTTLSEEGGSFPSENFVSNEKTYQYVIPRFSARSRHTACISASGPSRTSPTS
jgi:hypothetical protein